MTGLELLGFGARTAVGTRWSSSAASVRARLSRIQEHPYKLDRKGKPLVGAWAYYLPDELGVEDRMLQLAMGAAREALEPLRLPRPIPMGLVLSLPPARPGLPPALEDRLSGMLGLELQAFVSKFPVRRVVASGNAGGLLAMAAATTLLQQGYAELCLVGGVDSWNDADMLEWIDARGRLHAENNPWGIVPGEAAAFAVVGPRGMARRVGVSPYGEIMAIGTGHEEVLIESEGVCLGWGLTHAWRQALASVPEGHTIADIYVDRNPEPYRADEHGFTIVRCDQHFVDSTDFVNPADCWGDVGAATGILLTQLACAAGNRGYASGPIAFVSTASDRPERAAATVRLTSTSRT
jgi:3-oxoacyl-[acyl-carrier-protein] synthase I